LAFKGNAVHDTSNAAVPETRIVEDGGFPNSAITTERCSAGDALRLMDMSAFVTSLQGMLESPWVPHPNASIFSSVRQGQLAEL